MNPYHDIFWKNLYDWQTLVTGLVALLAGIGTVWATIVSAKREVDAAQAQTKSAQDQTRAIVRADQRRTASEAYAFMSALDAAMVALLDDVAAARQLFGNLGGQGVSAAAYNARRRIKKNGFAELRGACVRLGGTQIVTPFFRLDNEIDDFASGWEQIQGVTGTVGRIGQNGGLTDQLDRIIHQATSLRVVAAEGIKKSLQRLADTQNV